MIWMVTWQAFAGVYFEKARVLGFHDVEGEAGCAVRMITRESICAGLL